MNRAALIAIVLLAGCASMVGGGPEQGYGLAAGGRYYPGPQGAGGGAAQTPWEQHVNGGGFNLSDVGALEADTVTAADVEAGSVETEDLAATGDATFSGTVDFSGATVTGLSETISTQTAAYTPGSSPETINVTGNTTITLPSGPGGPYTIVKADDDADVTTVTGAQTINGSLNYALNTFGQWIKVVWNGTAWSIGSPLADAGTGNNNPASLTNLVAYWKFESAGGGVVDDSSSSNYDLPEEGGGGAPSYPAGKFGNGGDLGGGTSSGWYKGGGNHFNSTLFGNQNFSVSLWFKPGGAAGGDCILLRNWDASSNQWKILIPTGTLNVRWTQVNGGTATFTSSTQMTSGAWNHVVVRRNGGVLEILINGTQVGQITGEGTDSVDDGGGSGIAEFGCCNAQGNNPKTNGQIDDVAIWKGRYLTNDEVTRIYNGGTGRAIN